MSGLPPPKALNDAPWTAVQVYRDVAAALARHTGVSRSAAWRRRRLIKAAEFLTELVLAGDYATIRRRVFQTGGRGATQRLIALVRTEGRL